MLKSNKTILEERFMYLPTVHTLDLDFQGRPNTIGVFLIPHSKGAVLVECGPGTTIPTILKNLATFNLSPSDITDVLLTHIHLDHAGSAGWWATAHGATIHVHDVGAPHLIDPSKLIASATRIYGEQMESLWGEFIPVPQNHINPLQDNDEIIIGSLRFTALDTPGHANHHMSYLLDGVCFSGDVGGVHIQGVKAVRLPTVPPEFNIIKWRNSLKRLRTETIHAFATTHFGIHNDAVWHLDAVEKQLNDIETWMETIMSGTPSQDEMREGYKIWLDSKSKEAGLTPELIESYNTAISSQMSADGIYRYWYKHRNP
jgi:glyoxylase-like metal-dependent hydrolase (beta-lactamase superfamily II)